MTTHHDTLARLYRQEAARMIAVIGRAFGLAHIEVAEDVVGETFLKAAGVWEKDGLPAQPSAWLYAVARNKMLEHLRRQKLFAGRIAPEVTSASPSHEHPDWAFSEAHIQDSQLRMLFAVCHPAIAGEAQIGLALRILCGFTLDEIAEAFLTNKEAISKRLYRAREKLRAEGMTLELPTGAGLEARMDAVLRIIYLLFSEGFYSTTNSLALRKDLCLEALRLCQMLTESPHTDTASANALLALMCYHSSRFTARVGPKDGFVLYDDQDEALWDKALIGRGHYYLNRSGKGTEISSYHLEAAIARWHCQKEDTREKWEGVLDLYNKLLRLNYSPMVALNRTFALYKARGAAVALPEALKLRMDHSLSYHLLLAEIYKEVDSAQAVVCLRQALTLAKTGREREVILGRLGEG